MPNDPLPPLSYLEEAPASDRPPVEEIDHLTQDALLIASSDPASGEQIVLMGIDADRHPQPQEIRRLLDPSVTGQQVVCGWTTSVQGVDGDEHQLTYEMHWRDTNGGPWQSLGARIDLTTRADTTVPALLAAVEGVPVAIIAADALAGMLADYDAGRPHSTPPAESSILPRTPLTALAGLLASVAAEHFDAPAWEQMGDPPGPLASSAWAEMPSMRAAERLARKMHRAQLSLRHPRLAPFAPLIEHAKWAAAAAVSKFPDAHPVVISQQLLATLPDWEDSAHATDFALRAPLPLPVMYLDCSGEHGEPVRIQQFSAAGRRAAVSELALHGALVWRSEDEALHIVCFGHIYRRGPLPEPTCHLIYRAEPEPDLAVIVTPQGVVAAPPAGMPLIEAPQLSKVLHSWARAYGELVLSALMLTGAQRVDVTQRTLSRKQAKLSARRQQQPGWEIVVRPRKLPASATSSDAGSGQGRYAQPFWRRGHYKAFPIGTQMADAVDSDKLQWVPWKQEWCRLVWVPATIVAADAGQGVVRRVRRYTD